MTTNFNVPQKAARRKLNILELDQELESVIKACMITKYGQKLLVLPGRAHEMPGGGYLQWHNENVFRG